MPELPEVEVTRRGIAPFVEGRRLRAVTVREPRLRWPVPDPVRALREATVKSVKRRGKYLLLDCGRGHLIVHLGMSGSLRFVPAGTPPGAHDHVDFDFGERWLRLRDPRRFGAVLWAEGDPLHHPRLARLGLEPLEALDGARLYALSRGVRSSLKAFLLDGRRIAGVGNIYAAESLFLAGLRPARRASRITPADAGRLAVAIRRTLTAAIRAGGSSLRDFVRSDGEPGGFQMRYRVYERAGRPCRRCGTPIRRLVQSARSSYYCPHCQR